MKDEDKMMKHLKKLILDYLEECTSNPAIKSIEENIFVAYKLGNVLVTLKASEKLIGLSGYSLSPVQGLNIDNKDAERLKCLSNREDFSEDDLSFLSRLTAKTCSKRCLLPFIDNQVNWIVVSLMCSSYLSSIILMRSVFELLINIATTRSGGMSARIEKVPFFEPDEKRTIKKTWDELCSWSHPYERWLKNMCPIYVSYKPTMYHPEHFKNCVNLLEKVIDIYLVVSKEHFGMDVSTLEKERLPIDISAFPLFQSRIHGGKKQHRARIRDPLTRHSVARRNPGKI